jgi:uncharacterized Zn-binding protein involved in type VI secretion
MPAAHRQGDICSGHGCYAPRQNISWSTNVFVNNKGWHRQLDNWGTHCCGPHCHKAYTAEGSSMVFVNSRQAARIGDPLSCGSAIATGSKDVYCGG